MLEQKGKKSDDEIIQGIRAHDRQTLTEVYRQMFPIVQSMVKADGGSKADAWDVFQETLGVIYDKLVSDKDKFTLTSSFTTFFFAVSKRIWYKQLRRMATNERFLQEKKGSIAQNDEEDTLDALIRDNIMINLVWRNIEKLQPICRQLLEATLNGFKAEEMLTIVNLSSAQSVYNKRRNCIEKLFKLIKTDPDYYILKDYEKL